jgi:hypothetical protein
MRQLHELIYAIEGAIEERMDHSQQEVVIANDYVLVTQAREALTELIERLRDDEPAQELARETLDKLNETDNAAWNEGS